MDELAKQILGPQGLVVGTIIVAVFLARYLLRFVQAYIADLKTTIADLMVKLQAALDGWAAQTAANQTLANAQEARNRDDEMKHRLEEAAKQRLAGGS